jgi:hypothetical protein
VRNCYYVIIIFYHLKYCICNYFVTIVFVADPSTAL